MAGRCGEPRYADHIFFSDILQNAPFRSQFFKIFFASGGKGGIDPPNQKKSCGRSCARVVLPRATEKHCDSATTDDFAHLHDIH